MRAQSASNLFFFFSGILFFAGGVFAASGIARFVFMTDPQTIHQGERSGALQIQAQDANNKEIKTEETIDLEFLSTSSTGEFLNASSSPVSTVMGKGTANRTFYYRDFVPGFYTLKIKAQGRDSKTSWIASQTITVSDAAAAGSIPAPAPPPPATPTPTPTPTPTLTPPSSPQSSSGSFLGSKINADAGADQTVPAGSEVRLSGAASGLKKEPLDQARFWWNFGDGETQEGKFTTHIFRMPGTYIVGLHVASGEYGASDYLTIRVLENKMRVVRVLEGGEGYVQFSNPLNVETDIGDWVIQDATEKKFFIPSKTKVAAGAEISFSNAVTGLLQARDPTPVTGVGSLSVLYPLTVQYPNGMVAFTYTPVRPDNPVGQVAAFGSLLASVAATHVSGSSTPAHAAVSALMPKLDPTGEAKPTRSVSKRNLSPESIHATSAPSAAVSGGFSISSRILFAGAIGLSALGALGFFVLRQFLI